MILFKNACTLEIDPPRVREGIDVLVDGDSISRVGAGITLPESTRNTGQKKEGSKGSGSERTGSAGRIVDCTGKLLFPGLVCTHHHFYSGLARGMTVDLGPMPDFVSILRRLWWRVDRALDLEGVYSSGLVCSLDAIRAGTTAVIDHHASPSCIEGSLGTLRRAFEETGLRGACCYEVSDRNGVEGMRAGVAENAAFARTLDEEKQAGTWKGLMESHVGGHAPFTLPDDGLRLIADVVEETGRGFHVHVAEDRYDASYSRAAYGVDLLPRLDSFGLLSERTIIAHGLHLTEEEIELLNERDAFLVHNCRSNMNNGVGYNSWLPRVRNEALGTDGIGADMFEELKFAFFKHAEEGGPLGPDEFLRLLGGGYRQLERVFGRPFGRIEPGYTADLVIADYGNPTPLSGENVAGHMLFGMNSNIVESVMIGGRLVMEEREFPFDTGPVYRQAQEQATQIWERVGEMEP